jgi:hypothetical protein
MPAKNFLSSRQKEQLQTVLRESDCSHFRERVLMLLLMNDGKTYQEITDFIGCSYRTVAYWCVHGDPDNLESLKDKRQPGKSCNPHSALSTVTVDNFEQVEVTDGS